MRGWTMGLLAAMAVSVVAWRGETQPPNNVNAFMQMKLTHSQKLLEGLVIEDFKLIEKHAQDLSLLSQAATWQVLQTPEYLQHSGEFRRAANAVAEAARKKNLDGAALAYMETTLKCVSCHKYVRDVRMAGGPHSFPAEPAGD